MSLRRATADLKSEERLIPMIRARLAERLVREGFRPKEVAAALNVTQSAVTQYLKRKRGGNTAALTSSDRLIDPLAEKLVKRMRSGLGGIETTELVETARQVMVMNKGRMIVQERPKRPSATRRSESLGRGSSSSSPPRRSTSSCPTRPPTTTPRCSSGMIAADSIRHGDVVSQVMSWLEAGRESDVEMPGKAILESLIALEDSAHEASLTESIRIGHPIAQLLFQWIDADEEKHEKIVSKMLKLKVDRDLRRRRSATQ